MKTEASLHTAEELLSSAQSLIDTGNPRFMRSSILEALAALESYVQTTVFPLLEMKLDPNFVKWLKDKTKMDFDGRLQYIAPLALDTSVDVSSDLWRRYKEARVIRNHVAHHSRVATTAEAVNVLATVKEWLSYLGSKVEVDISLIDLKEYFEAFDIYTKPSEEVLIKMVRAFYAKTTPMASRDLEVSIGNMRADLVLDFGNYKAIFEIKSSKGQLENGLRQLEKLYAKPAVEENTRLILLIFTESEVPSSYDAITKINDYTSVVYIKI